MLDLDRHVVRDIGIGRMERVNHPHRVRRPVEEVGIPERDVLRTGFHLHVDVGEDDVDGDGTKLSLIDRHHGAMTAEMFASAARLGRADDSPAAVGELQRRVAAKRRQASAIGHEKLDARDNWMARLKACTTFGRFDRRAGLQACRCVSHQLFFELAAKHRVDSKRPQPVGVQRRVQAVRADPGRRVDRSHGGNDGSSEPRRRVHRQVNADEIGAFDFVAPQPFPTEIDADDVPGGGAKPRRGRGQAERLTSQFVGRDEQRVHGEPGTFCHSVSETL